MRSWLISNSCACDVPSHNYTWSFEPKLDWSGVYSSSKEICAYFVEFARKYQLKQYIKARHQVLAAYWNHQMGGYDVRVKDLESREEFSQHCDILVNASGILNNWRWPDIPGLDKYKGTLLHTANWDENVDLTGKHVGLIGNGYVFGQMFSFATALIPIDLLGSRSCQRFSPSPAMLPPSSASRPGFRQPKV